MEEKKEIRTLVSDEIIKEETDKDGNLVYIIKRKEKIVDKTNEEDEIRFVISEIKKTKVLKKGTIGIKQRAEIHKFGDCKTQSRGTVEAGLIRQDNEVKIANRKKVVYQEGLKEKLKTSSIMTGKEDLIKKMLDEQERKRNQNKEISIYEQQKIDRQREAKETDIKIMGFNMRCEEIDLIELFSKVGPVRKCKILRDKITKAKRNIAFLEFHQTTHVEEAIKKYNDKTVGGCVLMVSRPNDN